MTPATGGAPGPGRPGGEGGRSGGDQGAGLGGGGRVFLGVTTAHIPSRGLAIWTDARPISGPREPTMPTQLTDTLTDHSAALAHRTLLRSGLPMSSVARPGM